MAKKTKKKLVLIADSACDLPVEIIEQYGIVILPISIYFPEETRTQYVDITTEEFFKKLEEEDELPTTGVPSPRVYKQTFDKALEISDEGIMLDLSGDLSGIYNYGVVYSKQFAENKITVVDSRTATLPFGLLVLKTARMIEEGLTKEEILKKLKKIIPKVQLTAFLGTLKYLKRSGRISSVKHILGNLMQFKPLITIRNGVIDSPSRVRGDSASMEYLKNLGEKLTESLPKNETIVVLHSQNFEKAEELVQHIENSTKKKFEVLTWEIGPAIGVHVGPGALGLTWVGKPFEELLK
ncbi:MAG: DegV family protein [Candidatus Heimdallarchaeota archaeon]|nr:DegV family protein [Candidatus Heimdallarchaeota archaeon]MBY8993733.1 DegV family protein [Candidatus Heimdallarchaeota archaeon]